MVGSKNQVAIVISLLFVIASSSRGTGQNSSVDTYVHPPLRVQGQAQKAVVGLTPPQISKAYGLDRVSNRGAGQVIGIVDAFDHSRIEEDLAQYSSTFALPQCNSANGCFRKIYASGQKPRLDHTWALEIAVDVEWAHAIAPEAGILLVEAASDQFDDMMAAVQVAVQNGATVVSMSWGRSEFPDESANDNRFLATGVTFVAAAGNFGAGTLYPAVSPNVVAVGGTTLFVDSLGNYLNEAAWAGSGGGQSKYETEPPYQIDFPIPNNAMLRRGNPDVAYNADPATGFAVYDSFPVNGFSGWIQAGGTSAGTSQWAALLAIANSSRRSKGKAALTGTPAALYDAARQSTYHDITTGSNGTCGLLCTAAPGYDYVTGLGSPQANRLIQALASRS
jgi:subtilase family serine protease